jgi:putative transposase
LQRARVHRSVIALYSPGWDGNSGRFPTIRHSLARKSLSRRKIWTVSIAGTLIGASFVMSHNSPGDLPPEISTIWIWSSLVDWVRELLIKKSRYTEEQIIGILKQHEAGVKTADLCREHGISAATFSGWKQRFGGMEVSEAQRLKAMEDENRRLKLLVAELSLHGEALKAVIRKNGWSLPV